MTHAVLKLRDEEPDRPFITLGKDKYHFSLQSDLSISEMYDVSVAGRRFQDLGKSFNELSEDQVTSLVSEVRSAVKMVMHDMPDDVVESLSDGECVAILEAFVSVLPTSAGREAHSDEVSRDSATPTPSLQAS